METQARPQNLRQQTMQSHSDPASDFKRMSFSMNSRNVLGKNQVKKELLCALCQAILVEPWECKECHNRYHQVCLNKFAKETGQCPMQCRKPRFISIKKEVEKQLKDMKFVCNNQQLGCNSILSYLEVQDHDQYCHFQPVKCEAFAKCKTKCIRKEIDKHQAACPYILVPCIYCRSNIQRVNIMEHEQTDCPGTYTCSKCGMTIVKEETMRNSHHCFNALAGYLQNMLASKDYVINVFKDEIGRKNQLIEQLLEKQDDLELRLHKMEEILAYDQKKLPSDKDPSTASKSEEESKEGIEEEK